MKTKHIVLIAAVILLFMPFIQARAEEDYNYFPDGWDIKQFYPDAIESGDFQYNYWDSDGTAHIIGYTGSSADIIVPDTIDGHPVVDVSPFLFRKVHIQSITYGEGFGINNGKFVTNLFEAPYETEAIYVSEKHPYLKSEEGILYSKDGTILYECPPAIRMEKLVVPDSVTAIRSGAFIEAHSLKEIDFGEEGIIDTLYSIFMDSQSIETVYLNGVKNISGESFFNCRNLKTVVFGEGLESIGCDDVDAEDDSCFSGCTSLVQVEFPDSLRVIGNTSFSRCQSLDKILLSKNLTYIGNGAFRKCGNIGKLKIPLSCGYIGNNAFKDCIDVSLITPSYLEDDVYGLTAKVRIGKESIDVASVYKIGIRGGDKNLRIGESVRLKLKGWYKGEPYSTRGKLTKHKGNIAYKSIKTGLFMFESSDPEVVSVGKYGKITAKRTGTATITVKAYPNMNLICKCNVTVN